MKESFRVISQEVKQNLGLQDFKQAISNMKLNIESNTKVIEELQRHYNQIQITIKNLEFNVMRILIIFGVKEYQREYGLEMYMK